MNNALYTTEQMDKMMKVVLRLIDKFKPQLNEEYKDVPNIIDALYKEQCEIMPLPWYEYCAGVKND